VITSDDLIDDSDGPRGGMATQIMWWIKRWMHRGFLRVILVVPEAQDASLPRVV